jgi:hypothetical protein
MVERTQCPPRKAPLAVGQMLIPRVDARAQCGRALRLTRVVSIAPAVGSVRALRATSAGR